MKQQRKLQLGILACIILVSSFFLFVIWHSENTTTIVGQPVSAISKNILTSVSQEDETEKKQVEKEDSVTEEESLINNTDNTKKKVDASDQSSAISGDSGDTDTKGKDTETETIPEPIKYASIQIDVLNAIANLDKVTQAALPFIPDSGYMLSMTQVELQENDTAYSLLARVCKEKGIALNASNGYVRYIGDFGEFDAGSTSGWMYKINGTLLSVGSNAYQVKEHDVIEWRFTVKQGDI